MADGHVPSSLDKLMPVFGWWSLDPEGPVLVNTATGQRIRYAGFAQPRDVAPDEQWHRFEYTDREICYPILAKIAFQDFYPSAKGGPLIGVRVLCVDHDVSAVAWRSESNVSAEYPPFGIWRRVDDCITDGMVCWLGLDVPPKPEGLYVVGGWLRGLVVKGGWLNSQWSMAGRFRRDFPAIHESRWNLGSEGKIEADSPFIMPLNAPIPLPWQFYKFSAPGDDFFRQGGTDVIPSGYEVDEEPRPPMPFDEPRNGWAVYMASPEGRRVLMPISTVNGSSHAFSRTHFWFRYADQEVSADFLGVNEKHSSPSGWRFEFRRGHGRIRKPNGNGDLAYLKEENLMVPSHALWQRLKWAVLDSWLFFEGTSLRDPHWDPVLGLLATSLAEIDFAYLGGRWGGQGRCTAQRGAQL